MLLFFALLLPISMVAMEQNNGVFSFKLQDVTVKDIFKYIEKNSEYIFLYSTDKNLLKKINVDVNKKDITQVLDEILKNTTLIYDIDGKQIIIREKNASEKSQQKTTQKKKTIRGIVSDDSTQEPIIGATIRVNGSMTGTTSNIEGDFVLECAVGDTLTVSFVGYQDRSVLVKSGNIYAIALKESAAELGEVVVTAFGVGQKKESLVGSIQQIKPQELKVPSSSLSTAFAGRMAGVIAVQRSGEPGADGANFWIRGKSTFNGNTSALIIMDGVEISSTELNALDPEVIESFSILKDATATALYGTRGANGVMIVATKNGKNLDKPIINFRLEGAISTMTRVPNMVDGPTYMKMFNEAVSRPGCDVSPYSQEKIDGTIAGLNPYIYPNVDWFDEIFNKSAFSERANFNIRGGSSKMDYFMSASFKHSNGHLKSLSKDYFSYNNNVRNYNYDFINNLNISATRTTKISLGLNLSVADKKSPLMDVNDIFQLSMEANPVDFPVRFPANMSDRDFVLWGDKPGGIHGQGWYRNPVAEYVTGYKTNLRTTITANFKLAQELDMITKGLKFTGLFSFKNYSSSSTERSASYNHYYMSSYDPSSMEYKITRIGDEQSTALTNDGSRNGDRKMYFQAILDYNRIFKEVHDLNIMFLYNQEQYDINGPTTLFSSLPQRKQGVAGRVSYSYDGRYYIEGNFGYNGSENFAKGHRWGFFPSIALGYNISEESFFEPLRKVITSMKLRGSWGLVGNDQIGGERFIYMPTINLSGKGFTTGIDQNYGLSGPVYTRYENNSITWEVGEKINLGIDLQLLNSLNIVVDIFRETRRDIFQKKGTIPTYLGTGNTDVFGNLAEMKNQGLDLSIDYNKAFSKDFYMNFKGTFTYAHNEITKYDEAPKYAFQSKVGQSANVSQGYLSNGLFLDEAEIDRYNQQMGSTLGAGDIKYLNVSNMHGYGDDIVDVDDWTWIGNPTVPEIVYGFGPSFKYKNWDFSFFFQGVAKTSLFMSGFHPFGDNSLRNVLQFVANDRWSPTNQNVDAKYPRLTRKTSLNNTNPGNSGRTSDYWMRDGSFLKLKNMELGYTFKRMRFYISGSNLLTFSKFDLWDPEQGGGSGLKYPTQRVFNVGFQMTFNN